ncbi:MAG: preprotein translocase subunit SecE [Defluviitaleaceae bacterium]|nr:preprotein translocase subunit SecE [Defluviitaleaceae bacterium]
MKEFFGNIKQELKKITWPTDKEMKSSSAQVFVFMVILTLFFAGVDALIYTGVSVATRTPAPIVTELETADDDDAGTEVDDADASDDEVED